MDSGGLNYFSAQATCGDSPHSSPKISCSLSKLQLFVYVTRPNIYHKWEGGLVHMLMGHQ